MEQNFFTTPEFQNQLYQSFEMFILLFVELTLIFLAISYLVAYINQKVPNEKIKKLLGEKKGRGYFTAAGLGAITPFCSCSSIPMLIGLIKSKAGFGPTMTFLFTSPLLNPIIIALFIPLLGLKVTLFYALLALVTSIIAGWVLDFFRFDRYIKSEIFKQTSSQSSSCCGSGVGIQKEPSIYKKSWDEAFGLFRSMAPYMVIAMMIGALVHGFVPADFFSEVANKNNPLAVPTAALIGIPLYVRVSTLLPLVSSFLAKGASIGAIMALVIGSGGASLPELILLKRLFNWPLLLAFLTVIFSMAVIGGFSFNLIFA